MTVKLQNQNLRIFKRYCRAEAHPTSTSTIISNEDVFGLKVIRVGLVNTNGIFS